MQAKQLIAKIVGFQGQLGNNTIAAVVSLSRSTVKRALHDLAKAGLVEKM